MAEQLFRNTPKEPTFDSAATMCRHGYQIYILLGGVVQNLSCLISVSNMAFHSESFGLKPLFYSL
jgi:hypothetical protein